MFPTLQHFATSLTLAALAAVMPAQENPRQFRWPEGKRVAVSLSFDDARASQVDVGLPLFEKYGARATFFVNPPAVKRRVEGWKKALAAGQEIGNHTTSHPCTVNYPFSAGNPLEEFSLRRIRQEMDGASAEIERLLGVTPVTFAYPCGQKFVGRGTHLKSYVPEVAKRFLAARGFLDEGPNDPARCDLAQLMGMVSDGLTFEQMRNVAAGAAKQGGWLVFAGHEIGDSGPQTTRADALDEFLRYARDPANGVWLDTVQAVAKYIQASRGSGLH